MLDGEIAEWVGMPASRHNTTNGNEKWSLWLARGEKGLIVAGRVREPGFAFARSYDELERAGRVEIWLSVADPFELPDFTYDEDDCAEGSSGDAAKKAACLAWVKEQKIYRERLLRQFSRVWRVAPGTTREMFALPAYDALTADQVRALRFKRPADTPASRFEKAADGATTFEILIPWSLFPPANRLSLDQLRIQVDIATGPDPVWLKDREGIPVSSVLPPITTRLSRCAQPLLIRDYYGNDEPAFYFLQDSLDIDQAFAFDNPDQPYKGPLPENGELSPILNYSWFSSQEIGESEYFCDPFMSYRKGAVSLHYGFHLSPGPTIKSMPDGSRLIRIGPEASVDPQSRKAFVHYSTTVYVLTQGLEAYVGLTLGSWSDETSGYEVEFSEDWRIVTEFRQEVNDGPWSSEKFCLSGTNYLSCGKNPNSAPPALRVLTENH